VKSLAAVVVGVSLAALLLAVAVRIAPPVQAQTSVADTTSAPFVTLQPDTLCKFWSNQAAARSVATDAQWTTAMATLFSTSTSPGVDPTALAFLRSFFVQYVHVGP
jgi:pseudouridine-5'-phosphate glycosidase